MGVLWAFAVILSISLDVGLFSFSLKQASMRACGRGTMHVMGPYKFVLHDFAHRGYTWHSYDLTIGGPVGHVLMLL